MEWLEEQEQLEQQGFPRPFRHAGTSAGGKVSIGGGMGGTSAGGKVSIDGGTYEGAHGHYGGDLTLIDYNIN